MSEVFAGCPETLDLVTIVARHISCCGLAQTGLRNCQTGTDASLVETTIAWQSPWKASRASTDFRSREPLGNCVASSPGEGIELASLVDASFVDASSEAEESVEHTLSLFHTDRSCNCSVLHMVAVEEIAASKSG